MALTLAFLPCAYAAQAGMKLKRSLGPDRSLSDCSFSVYTERVELGPLSLPLPKVSCTAKEREFVWLPTRNAWEPFTWQGKFKIGC